MVQESPKERIKRPEIVKNVEMAPENPALTILLPVDDNKT
jgi:hypothetical protein